MNDAYLRQNANAWSGDCKLLKNLVRERSEVLNKGKSAQRPAVIVKFTSGSLGLEPATGNLKNPIRPLPGIYYPPCNFGNSNE